LLAIGQFASNVGDAFYAVALPWYVLAVHGGPLLLGTVLAAYGIPRTALIAVGGQASDRWRPWTVMMGSDAVRVLAMAALAVATALGPARAVILVPIAVVLGAGEGMFLPGSFSIVPELLPDEDLQAGNALVLAGTQVATLAGPAIGGVIVAAFGSSPAFALDAASFAISAVTLAGVRAGRRSATTVPATPAAPAPVEAAPAGAEPKGGPTVAGLLRSERILQVVLLVVVAANLGSGGVGDVALPALAHGPMHTGAGGYGGLIATLAAGALAGTLVAGHVGRLRRPAIVASAAYLVEALAMGIAPYLGGALGAGVALFVFGLMNGFGNVVMITVWQRWAPPKLLGRLNGLLMIASFGTFPVSVLLTAIVVRGLGPAAFFPMAGGTLGLAIFAGLTQTEWRNYGVIQDSPGTASTTATAAAPGDRAPGETRLPGSTPAR
jgi:predicted MFS family arabinose efflux permease